MEAGLTQPTTVLEYRTEVRLTDDVDGVHLEPPVVHEAEQLDVDDELRRGVYSRRETRERQGKRINIPACAYSMYVFTWRKK